MTTTYSHIICNSCYLLVLPQGILKRNSVTYLVLWFNVCPFRQEKVHHSNVTRSRSAHKRRHTILMQTNESKKVTYYTVTRLGRCQCKCKLVDQMCLPWNRHSEVALTVQSKYGWNMIDWQNDWFIIDSCNSFIVSWFFRVLRLDRCRSSLLQEQKLSYRWGGYRISPNAHMIGVFYNVFAITIGAPFFYCQNELYLSSVTSLFTSADPLE